MNAVQVAAHFSMPICLCIENKTIYYIIPNIFFTKHIYYLYYTYFAMAATTEVATIMANGIATAATLITRMREEEREINRYTINN